MNPTPASTAPSARPTPRRARWTMLWTHPAHMLAFGFGSGLSPWVPGTVGSLFGWISYLALDPWLGASGWAWAIGLGFALGIPACAITARTLHTQDPGAVVWDEVVAMWLVLWLTMPMSLAGQLAAFVVFRLFDIVKPGPIGWADRRFGGGFGIMFDDLLAALATLLVFALARSVTG
jgi:phosphatidylglycerophosphatase A